MILVDLENRLAFIFFVAVSSSDGHFRRKLKTNKKTTNEQSKIPKVIEDQKNSYEKQLSDQASATLKWFSEKMEFVSVSRSTFYNKYSKCSLLIV